jgi:molybdopterin-binding protein
VSFSEYGTKHAFPGTSFTRARERGTVAYALPKQLLTAGEAARELGVSLDTIRRWDRSGRIRTARDSANRRVVERSEIERLRGRDRPTLSARNRLRGIVRDVEIDGVLARVEIDITEPARVVAIVTSESVEELGLKPGAAAGAVVKASSVMVER